MESTSTPDRPAERYLSFLRSLWTGAIYLISRLRRNNILVLAARLRDFLGGETIIRTISEHMDLIRVLNNSGARTLTELDTNYANKYLKPYLAKSFSKADKRAILKFHHQFLQSRVSEAFYQRVSPAGCILWTDTIEDSRYTISMSFDAQWHSEGDLSLALLKDDTTLYLISFTIVPGSLIGCTSEQVLMVGRVHGSRGQAAAIRDATHECHRIAPPHLLMAAVETIAAALAIDTIAGVNNKEQLVKREQDAKFLFDYDAFWETFAFVAKGAAVYVMPVPFARRTPSGPARRSKARRQRQRFKEQVASNVGAAFFREFVEPSRSLQRAGRQTTM
jgi:uncharacterized protein VirK/YbjX